MLRRKLATGEIMESSSLRREKAALERLRREVGERLDDVKRREAALEKRLRRLDEAAAGVDPELERGLEERSLGLDRREEELREREQALGERERALADREAIVAGPEEIERLSAEIDKRHAELEQAELLFLRTRQELAARSEALALVEEELRRRERELGSGGIASSAVILPPLADDETPRSRTPATVGFSGGLRDLQHRGTRGRRRPT